MAVRLKLSTILQVELAVLVAFAVLAASVPSWGVEFAYTASTAFLLFVMHAAVLPWRGFAFVIHDEPPDSVLKYYFLASIFLAAFCGGYLRDLLVRLAS